MANEILWMMMGIGGLFGIIFGYIYFNPFQWVQLKRNFTKKNYGIVYFTSRGRALYPKIVNFGEDVLRKNDGLWVLYEGAIYRQVGKEEPQGTETKTIEIQEHKGKIFRQPKTTAKVKLHKEIKSGEIEYRQGVPVMFLDIEDMLPLRLLSEKMTLPITRNPYMIEAVLGKEVAAAELEALKMTKKSLKMLIMITAVLVIITLALVAINWMDTQRVGAMTYQINQTLGQLIPKVPA